MYFVCSNDVRCMEHLGISSKEVGRVEKPELLGRSQRSANCEKVPACSHSLVVRVNLASPEFAQLRAFLLAKPSSHRIGVAYTGNSCSCGPHTSLVAVLSEDIWTQLAFNFQYCLSTWSPPSIIERDEISKIYLIKLGIKWLKNESCTFKSVNFEIYALLKRIYH